MGQRIMFLLYRNTYPGLGKNHAMNPTYISESKFMIQIL